MIATSASNAFRPVLCGSTIQVAPRRCLRLRKLRIRNLRKKARVHNSMVQLLTPEGTLLEHPDFAWEGTPDDLRASLRDMWLGRRFDAEATALQRHGELG